MASTQRCITRAPGYRSPATANSASVTRNWSTDRLCPRLVTRCLRRSHKVTISPRSDAEVKGAGMTSGRLQFADVDLQDVY